MPLTIGRLAEQAETEVETVRYYQRAGLLSVPEREDGGFRTYGPEHAKHLRFIRRARRLGLPLASIATLLDLAERRDEPCAAIDRIVQAHRDDVDTRIADLVRLRHELDHLLERCVCGRVSECRIVETLNPDPVASTDADEDRGWAQVSVPADGPCAGKASGCAIRQGSAPGRLRPRETER